MRKLLAVLEFSFAAATLSALSMPTAWDFGTIGNTHPVTSSISILNDARETVSLTILPSCDCVSVEPSTLTIAPGASREVRVSFDPAGYSGAIDKAVLVRVKGGSVTIFSVRGIVLETLPAVPNYPGECEWCRKQPEEARRQAYELWRSRPNVVRFYYSADCAVCQAFLADEVPRLSAALGVAIEVDKREIREPGVLAELYALLSLKKTTLTAIPVTMSPGWQKPLCSTTASSLFSIHIAPNPGVLINPRSSSFLTTMAS